MCMAVVSQVASVRGHRRKLEMNCKLHRSELDKKSKGTRRSRNATDMKTCVQSKLTAETFLDKCFQRILSYSKTNVQASAKFTDKLHWFCYSHTSQWFNDFHRILSYALILFFLKMFTSFVGFNDSVTFPLTSFESFPNGLKNPTAETHRVLQ